MTALAYVVVELLNFSYQLFLGVLGLDVLAEKLRVFDKYFSSTCCSRSGVRGRVMSTLAATFFVQKKRVKNASLVSPQVREPWIEEWIVSCRKEIVDQCRDSGPMWR